MPTRFSEKHLLLALGYFAASIFLLIDTTIFASPVRISEKGILLGIAACTLFFLGMRLLKRAAQKA